jgi:hypothetical protein
MTVVLELFWINELDCHNGGCGTPSTFCAAAEATKDHDHHADCINFWFHQLAHLWPIVPGSVWGTL